MADVINRFGGAYMAEHGASIPYAHIKAMRAITRCRTPAAGGHVLECDSCGDQTYAYHSCRHRACTRCGKGANDAWADRRRNELLPVRYFQVVFTVPKCVARLIRKHQRVLYPIFIKASGETLKKMARNPKRLGGELGIMTVLHTWTRQLKYHPHTHNMVPAVYINPDGDVCEVDKPYLFPHKALAKLFKGKLLAMMKAAVDGLQVPRSAYIKKWVVHVEQPSHGDDIVLGYLARYIHRTALSDRCILKVEGEKVHFSYRSDDRKGWKTMCLRGREFLRRFLQHVVPQGLHRVRYFGFWNANSRHDLADIKATLLKRKVIKPPPAPTPEALAEAELAPKELPKCACCDKGRLFILRLLDRDSINYPGPAALYGARQSRAP